MFFLKKIEAVFAHNKEFYVRISSNTFSRIFRLYVTNFFSCLKKLFRCMLDFQNLNIITFSLVIFLLSVSLAPRRVLQCEDGNIFITIFSMFGNGKE